MVKMIDLERHSVVEDLYWEENDQMITTWKIEGTEYKNEFLQYFYTLGVSYLGTLLLKYESAMNINPERYKKASESEYTANIQEHRQSAEQFVKNLMCIQKPQEKEQLEMFMWN